MSMVGQRRGHGQALMTVRFCDGDDDDVVEDEIEE